jgi:protein-S-isoprenylcysteine O-methyltransferase Ste14
MPMRSSAFEFRFRMIIQIVIVFVGFWAPWLNLSALGPPDLGRHISTLEWLALELSRTGLVRFTYATPIVIVLGSLAAAAGAVFRIWGSAYLGYRTVHHGQMQAETVMAAGPYRYVRNPLYIGGWFMMLAIALLAPPSGALFIMILITVFYLRLILGEEAFLTAQQGESYRDYLRAVPRLFPSLHSGLPQSPAQLQWLIAILSEINPIGIFLALAILSWRYDNLLMIKAILISFGLSLVVRALIPGEKADPEAA